MNDCPFDYTLNKRLKEIKRRTGAGLLDRQKIEKEFRGESFEKLYQMIVTDPYSSEDLVFTHGDFSVPNVVIHHTIISGFIDIADIGIGI